MMNNRYKTATLGKVRAKAAIIGEIIKLENALKDAEPEKKPVGKNPVQEEIVKHNTMRLFHQKKYRNKSTNQTPKKKKRK